MKTVVVLTGIGTIGLVTIASMQSKPRGFWAPDGYVAQANALIDRGFLQLQCAGQDSIVSAFPPGSPAERFFDRSYLRADVRAFNSSPDAGRSPLLVEGCHIVGIDPFYHRIDLPFNRLPHWRGDVLLTSDSRVAKLIGGADQELEVRHPGGVAEATTRPVRVAPDEANARISTPLLHLRRPDGAEVLASLFFVGPSPVLVDRRDRLSADRIRLNGFRSPPGRAARLEAGDWVQFESGGSEAAYTYLVATDEQARLASFVRVRNGRVRRLFPAARLRPFLEPLSQAIDLALQSIPGADDPDARVTNAGVRLMLDHGLHRELQEVLIDWCVEHRHPTRPRVVSLLVMDAFTGAVRAMPSCPGEPELAPYEPLTSRTRQRFLRNQNLVPHPVGSAAKPFWAAAVASTFPNFLDLRIPPHPAGPADSALGCPLRAGYEDAHGSEQWVGMEEFIRRSCNRYLIQYVTAALAVGSGPDAAACTGELPNGHVGGCFPDAAVVPDSGGAPVRFCDALIHLVLAPALPAVGRSCDELGLVHEQFRPAPALERIAGISTYGDVSPAAGDEGAAPLGERYRAGRYRTGVWRRLLDALREAGDTAHTVQTRLRFSSVSPEATNLALNTVEQLRTDWVNLLLGGENSRWSNFALAEALARLVTGTAVRGGFVDSVGVGGAAEDERTPVFAALSEDALHPGVRRRVLHAMELAASPGGTAAGLAPALASLRERLRTVAPDRPYDLYVFAKTGTPAITKYVSGAQERLVRRLYDRGALQWMAAERRFVLEPEDRETIRRTLGTQMLRWLREDVLAPMEREPWRFRAREGEPLPSHPLYFTADGRLRARDLRDLRVHRQGGVLLLGFLAVPADRGRDIASSIGGWISACPLDPGLRRRILEIPPRRLLDPAEAVAMTTAIYLDDLAVGQGSGRAVALAGHLLDPIGAYLEEQVRRKRVVRAEQAAAPGGRPGS